MIARWVESAQRRKQYPQEPWLWRPDWAERSVRDESSPDAGCLWAFSLLWILFTLPLALLFRTLRDRDPKFALTILFPLFGVLLMLVALYHSVRRWRYGTSLCRLDRVPIALGGTLRGELEVRLREMPASGIEMRLACVHRSGSGSRNQSPREQILWQNEQTVTHGAMPGPEGLRIPFRFDIPRDGEPSTKGDPRDRILWRLDVSAQVPGVDLAARFDLPVFRVDNATEFVHTPEASASSWQPAPEIEVAASRVRIRPLHRPIDWLTTSIFIVIWFGALAAFRSFGVPLLIVLFFAAIGSLVFVMVGDFLLRHTTLTSEGRSIKVRHTWFGLGSSRAITAGEVDRVEPVLGSTFGNRAFHDVRVRLLSGGTRKIARHLRNRRDAEMLAAWVTRALGK